MRYDKQLQKSAEKVCGKGNCYAPFNCNHTNRVNGVLSSYGSLTTCPLSKYDVKPVTQKKKFDIDSILTKEDISRLCSACEHAKFEEEDGLEYILHDMHICIDCPVYSCLESILECEAEARICL